MPGGLVEVGHRGELLVDERVRTLSQLQLVAGLGRDEELLGADGGDDDVRDLLGGAPCAAVRSARACSTNCASSERAAASDSGRLRAELVIRVATEPGTTADTVIGAPIARRSWARHSVAAWAANLETVYGPENAFVQTPAIEVVFTMCAGVPAASMRGTNARMPFRIPHRLTPSVHSKSACGRSHMSPPANTPALLQSTSVAPNVS